MVGLGALVAFVFYGGFPLYYQALLWDVRNFRQSIGNLGRSLSQYCGTASAIVLAVAGTTVVLAVAGTAVVLAAQSVQKGSRYWTRAKSGSSRYSISGSSLYSSTGSSQYSLAGDNSK